MMLALYKRLVHICARRQHDSRERKQNPKRRNGDLPVSQFIKRTRYLS